MAGADPESTPQHHMLHASAPPDFLECAHEWRRLFAEAWGTFLLVVVAAGAAVVGARSNGEITLSMKVVAPGLMVMAIIYFMGTVSGARLNPAVTLAFAARRNFPWSRTPGYIVAQLGGGIVAAWFLRSMFGIEGLLGATTPGADISDFKAFVMEVLLTTGLVSTILGTASGARNVGSNGALAVAGYIALAGLWAAPISGASMNPVRSFAPDLIRGDLSTDWIYVAGPVLGAMIAVGFEWILKGPAYYGRRLGGARGRPGEAKPNGRAASLEREALAPRCASQERRSRKPTAFGEALLSKFRTLSVRGRNWLRSGKRWVPRIVKRLGISLLHLWPESVPRKGFAQLGAHRLRRIKWKWLAQSPPSMETTIQPKRR